jgi:hypothetical protein
MTSSPVAHIQRQRNDYGINSTGLDRTRQDSLGNGYGDVNGTYLLSGTPTDGRTLACILIVSMSVRGSGGPDG